VPYIPHTEDDVRAMLDTIGVQTLDELFEEIPAALQTRRLDDLPEQLNELQVTQLMKERAKRNRAGACFVGAGAYQHHIPAAAWEITTRGEFYSAYTPYQAEASQGTLQLIYEFQTMISRLMAMDAANASLYEGASALAEAILMATRANRKSKSKTILIPKSVHPNYVRTSRTIVSHQGINLVEIPFDPENGCIAREALAALNDQDITALVVQQPNFFGQLEDVAQLTDWAHARGAIVIALVNPLATAVLVPPGQWGSEGADIACGEGQPLGIPLSGGGPYFGFMACKTAYVRQMPGRIVGRTVDTTGREGFVLTLQAREQHIRRSKATSNICTNQGLMVTAATIYMALLGGEGLARTAAACHANTRRLVELTTQIEGVSPMFDAPFFHEAVLRLEKPVDEVLAQLDQQGILGGYSLSRDFPELGNALLVCATETKQPVDLEHYAASLEQVMTAN